MKSWISFVFLIILVALFQVHPLPFGDGVSKHVEIGKEDFYIKKYHNEENGMDVYYAKFQGEKKIPWNEQILYIKDEVEFYQRNGSGDWIPRCVILSKDFGMDFQHALYAVKGGSKMYFYPDGSLALFELAHPSEWEYDRTLLPLEPGTHVELYENGLLKEGFIRQATLYYADGYEHTFNLREGGRIAFFENYVPRMLSLQEEAVYPLGEQTVLWKPHDNERHQFYDEGDVGFHKNWAIAWGYPAHAISFEVQEKQLYIQAGERSFFSEEGNLLYGVLNSPFDYQTQYGIIPLMEGKPISFHENGQLSRGVLSKTMKIDEMVYPQGYEIKFLKNGGLIQ